MLAINDKGYVIQAIEKYLGRKESNIQNNNGKHKKHPLKFSNRMDLGLVIS